MLLGSFSAYPGVPSPGALLPALDAPPEEARLSGGAEWLPRERADLGSILELLSPTGISLNSRIISFYFTSVLCQVPVT